MAKRISSLFSLNRDDSASIISQSSASSQYHDASQGYISPYPSPSKQKLTKHRVTSSPNLAPLLTNASFGPLTPPPIVTAMGVSKTYSRDGSNSRPSSRNGSPGSSREGSRSRPQTPVGVVPLGPSSRPGTPDSAKVAKRRSWLPGKPARPAMEAVAIESRAWIAGLREHVPYDIGPLLQGSKIPDLWNEEGNVEVYLFPSSTGRGPSAKLDSTLLQASASLLALLQPVNDDLQHPISSTAQSLESQVHGISLYLPEEPLQRPGSRSSFYGHGSSFSVPNNASHQIETRLYIPMVLDHDYTDPSSQPRGDDLELLVLYRNFLAFLTGGALVSTPRQASLYNIFVGISSILKRYRFTNADESTFGDVPRHSFERYCNELRLADVRASREKTIEAIVIGEHMKHWELYNEGFVHAAGRLGDIKSIQSPKYAKISPTTANRLERANIDVEARLLTVRNRLEDLDFSSMFAGLANSQTAVESKIVRFKQWRLAFDSFRRHVLTHYRHKFGAWPPKASSKKNNFEESGLNRLVLRELYQDFSDLYDMLVDRTSMTTRTTDLVPLADDAYTGDIAGATRHALRRIEGEYDSSDVPVHPPIPFDVPLVPTFMQSFSRVHVMLNDNSGRSTRRLKDNEVNEILLGSYNRESMKATPWIQDFIAFERRMGNGKSLDEIVDMRIGQWLFMYAVLQSLPIVVVDARDLKFVDGVEYFICLAPRGGRPWMKEETSQSRAWYNVANGGGLVSLPADLVDHSTEGIYRRSHCWTVAAQWVQDGDLQPEGYEPPPPMMRPASPYASPHSSPRLSPYVSAPQQPASPGGLRPASPVYLERPLSRSSNRNSTLLGLQEAAPPPGAISRPVSSYNPNLTFDSILGVSLQPQGKKGKKDR